MPVEGMLSFDYREAFSRNIGWVSEPEQALLRQKTVAIAGLGGVGGFHLLTLARLGVGRFRIADPDSFEIANFNRQAGASVSTVGVGKAEALADMARDINPTCEIEVLTRGVEPEAADGFLKGVDLYVDGLDFFAFEARAAVFASCARLGVPAVTAAPLGFSAALLNFLPGSMTFEGYFRWAGCSELEKAVRFLVGLAPALQHRHYLVDRTRVDLRSRRGPSSVIACQLCAGVASGEALKLLLGRGKVRGAPHGFQFDAYRNRFVHTWRPGGNANPLNRAAIALVSYQLGLHRG